MDENKETLSGLISEPDEAGVRYYNTKRSKPYTSESEPHARKNTLRNSLIIFGCIILGIVILGVACNSMTYGIFAGREAENFSLPSSPYIATVYVEGTIQQGNTDYFGSPLGYQHQWTLDAIDDLIYDNNNKGLVIFIDSPGGGVYESDELYFKIKEYQETTGNPVYAAMGSMAASGGYYIAAPADKVIANRNCWTGSIGVTLGTLVDVSGFLESYGIKTTTITSGENKAMGGNFDPLTKDQQAIFQGLVDEAYEQFVGIVAEGRGMDIAEVKKLADGRIYTAKQALDLGLIDGIGTKADAIFDMQETYGLEDCTVADMEYVNTSLFGNLFGKLNISNLKGQGDVAAIMELLGEQNQFPVSYMCEVLK